jgi:pimeloyl-ACP methyl ester carboxylesterase
VTAPGPAPALLPTPGLRLVDGPAGPVEYLLTGGGSPVTVFVHGLTGSIAQTRPFGSGVTGTRAFLHLRGHGGTAVPLGADAAPHPGDYRDLAGEVCAVARACGATRGVGVSLGAGALARLLADHPGALERAVLMLPSALDEPSRGTRDPAVTRLQAMADAVDAGDVEGLARLLRDHQPAAVRARPQVRLWARRRAAELIGTPVAVVLRGFAGQAPLADAGQLAGVTCPVLVIGQDGDEVHPLGVARRYAEALPAATLEVLPAGGVGWAHRDRLRELIAGFLDAGSGEAV